MGFRRLVVHVGAPKTATTAIQASLFSNRDALAAQGVYLPRTGRIEFSPRMVNHHHLAWEDLAPWRFPGPPGAWERLERELAGVDAETVLLSSEEFFRALAPGQLPTLETRLRSLCEDITVVVFVREQLALINSFYGQRVKLLSPTPDFATYARSTLSNGLADLDAGFSPWYDSPGLTLRAVAVGGPGSPAPLSGLLDAADIPVPSDLDLDVDFLNPSLGPVGIEATLLTTRHVRGRFGDFNPHDLSGRKFHRIAARGARDRGWCEDRFWGWTPDLAEEVVEHLAPSNERFARAVWGTSWPLVHPVDRPRRTARVEDLPPHAADHVSRFVLTMTGRYARLREEAASPRSAPPPSL